VKELKRVSNSWLKAQGRDFADFEWRGGYADFSLSQSNLDQMKEYIVGQEEHHRKMRFQDERALLWKHEIGFDERYVCDRGATPLGLDSFASITQPKQAISLIPPD
jgi:hypothetical protein